MSQCMKQFCNTFEQSVGKVQQLSKSFCQPLGITTFGYVRVFTNGTISWVTSNPEQDHFLLESGALNEDPLVNTKEALQEGAHLWFNDRKFPGSKAFYSERARRFQLDHGMVLVRHQKNYLETCCFSGLLTKRPLYNSFVNKKGLFCTFMEHFTQQLDRRLLTFLEEGIPIGLLKSCYGQSTIQDEAPVDYAALAAACGWKNLLLLSPREKQCLALLREGYTFQGIGETLELSTRTIEHYIESVKNKLGCDSRHELYLAAEKLCSLDLG